MQTTTHRSKPRYEPGFDFTTIKAGRLHTQPGNAPATYKPGPWAAIKRISQTLKEKR